MPFPSPLGGLFTFEGGTYEVPCVDDVGKSIVILRRRVGIAAGRIGLQSRRPAVEPQYGRVSTPRSPARLRDICDPRVVGVYRNLRRVEPRGHRSRFFAKIVFFGAPT